MFDILLALLALLAAIAFLVAIVWIEEYKMKVNFHKAGVCHVEPSARPSPPSYASYGYNEAQAYEFSSYSYSGFIDVEQPMIVKHDQPERVETSFRSSLVTLI